MKHLRIIYLPNKLLLAQTSASQIIEHNGHWYIPWPSLNSDIAWAARTTSTRSFYWQHGLVEHGHLAHTTTGKQGPLCMRGLLPNPLFPLSYKRLILSKAQAGLAFEEYTPGQDRLEAPLSLLEHEFIAPPGDERLHQLISREFELLDHRPEDQSTLYKHCQNGRLFQLLTMPEEEVQGRSFPAIWVFSEITHPQWAYNYLRQRERKKRGHSDLVPSEYLQMLEVDPAMRPCAQAGCGRHRIKHSNLC